MTNELIAGKKIAIVGGGPGGLTLARLLQMNGVDVTVFERDINKDARSKGATLDLHDESGLKALREAGLMDALGTPLQTLSSQGDAVQFDYGAHDLVNVRVGF